VTAKRNVDGAPKLKYAGREDVYRMLGHVLPESILGHAIVLHIVQEDVACP
jgi:hypothetical protein